MEGGRPGFGGTARSLTPFGTTLALKGEASETSKPSISRRVVMDIKHDVKKGIDNAAAGAKKATDKTVDATKAAGKAVGDKTKEAGQKIKDASK